MNNSPLIFSSYNVLGPSHTHYLQQAKPEFLAPESRFPLLIAALQGWKHHIYALQEAELPFLMEVQRALPSYSCFFAQRPQQKADGLAFLVHHTLHVRSLQSRFFLQPNGHPSSRLCQQLLIDWQGSTLAIVQTHISYDNQPPSQHAGLYQMKQCLAGLPHRSCRGIVLCGDWNAPTDHPVFQESIQHGFVDALAEKRYPTCFAGNKAMAIDHIVHSNSVRSQALELADQPMLADLPNNEQGSDHLPVGIALHWK